MKPLSPGERRALRARAHALSPVVMISGAGLSETVLAEIERGLKSHELIKIRVFGDDRGQREALLEEICRRSGADLVQHIGKVLVIHRKNPKAEPAPETKRPARAKRAPSPQPSPKGRGRNSKPSPAGRGWRAKRAG